MKLSLSKKYRNSTYNFDWVLIISHSSRFDCKQSIKEQFLSFYAHTKFLEWNDIPRETSKAMKAKRITMQSSVMGIAILGKQTSKNN